MSNRAHRPSRKIARKWYAVFMRMLPRIRVHARIAFRALDPEAKAEAIQDVTANAWKAFVALVKRGKAAVAYASPLAMYGIRQYRDHRRVGSHLNVKDVSSSYCQQRKGIHLARLDKFDSQENAWEEVLVEDRHCGPAQVACTRIDFDSWLKSLPCRYRRLAQYLGVGNRTSDAARKFKLSAGRISQIRGELAESWKRFVGDDPGPAAVAA